MIRFLGFNLQMLDTKLRPTGTMKSKDKTSKQFGHVNATDPNSCLKSYTISENPLTKLKLELMKF